MAGKQSGVRSTQTHEFSRVANAEIPRSSFDRSSGYKTTFDIGHLVPFFLDEALPGDTFNLKTSGFVRMATPIFPIMDNMMLDTFYFAVPNRIIWDNWVKMMGEQDNPGDSTDFVTPEVDIIVGLSPGSLGDYFGIPTSIPDVQVSALFSRAYYTIYNQWFRDENLQDTIPVSKGDGPDFELDLAVLPQIRFKNHDYFTSCLPFPQKGPDVTLPLGPTAPVVSTGTGIPLFTTTAGSNEQMQLESGAGSEVHMETGGVGFNDPIKWGSTPSLEADLTGATAATINQLREAFQVQKMYEKDARGGTRYTEVIRMHFGVTSPDARLQRAEYLGGGTTPVNISPIHATADTLTDVQTGRELAGLSAVGTASFNNHGFTKSFTEHSIIIGICCVRADLTYQQGLNRMWSRLDRFDYYWPSFAHLGEQEVLNQEIFLKGAGEPQDIAVFGYQERFAEYRYKPSQVTGQFRSNDPLTLDAWHLSEEFLDLPTLSATFMRYNIPLARCLAVVDEPQFIADFYHKLTCARPMPLYGTPGDIDRF